MKTSTVTKGGSQYLLVSHGNSSAKIYTASRQKSGATYSEHTLVYVESGKRARRTFSDLDSAKSEAARVLIAITNGQSRALTLNNVQADEFTAASEVLHGTGIGLLDACRQFRSAVDALAGKATISESVRYFLTNASVDLPQRTVAELVAEMLAAKEKDGASSLYLRDLKIRCSQFARAFPGRIAEIKTEEINGWLRKIEGAKRTRNNMAGAISALFSFAKDEGYLAKDRATAAEGIKRAKITDGGEVEIFTPEEMRRMLQRVETERPEFLPFLLIGGFAGLRQEEILRLSWDDVNLAAGHIRLTAEKTKTRVRRIVPIQPNLAKWLQPYAQKIGPVCPIKKIQVAVQGIVETATENVSAVEWKRNGLRHSFGSYRLPILKNAPKLALEMGNSPNVIFSSYREVVTEAQAMEWWAINP